MFSSLGDRRGEYAFGAGLDPGEGVARGNDPAQHVVQLLAAKAHDLRNLRNGGAWPELELVPPGHLIDQLEDR
jgi:hypothetical protein